MVENVAIPLYRYTAIPLYRFTALPLYRFTALPLYRFTAFSFSGVTFSVFRWLFCRMVNTITNGLLILSGHAFFKAFARATGAFPDSHRESPGSKLRIKTYCSTVCALLAASFAWISCGRVFGCQ